MRYPQILVYEKDTHLADALRPLAQARQWTLREPRRPDACIRLLRRGGPGVLVVRFGRDVEGEMELLEEVSRLAPDTQTIVVDETDNALLAGLAWDLGATCVLTPPHPGERLPEVVGSLMTALAGESVPPPVEG
jgi:DNA-binding NtrC family response regulator